MNSEQRPRRVLHVTGGLSRGGIETWLVQAMQYVPRSAYAFDFLVLTPGPHPYSQEVEAMGSRILVCRRPNVLAFCLSFLRLLRTYGPFAVVDSHVHHFSGLVLMLAAAAGVPARIVHSHFDARFVERQASWTRRAYLGSMRRLISRFATEGCAVSEASAEDLFTERWSDDHRWRVTPLGIDLTPFTVPVDRAEVRQELGIPASAYVVGHIGRFVDQKNHEFFVDVAGRFAGLRADAHFLLLGGGPLRTAIEAKVAALGLSSRFTFAGVRSDVPRVIKGAIDVFLFPSKYEGLGLVVLEAQAAGLRSLVSDAVPSEADIAPGYVTRKPLGAWPEEWASELRAIADAGAPGAPPQLALARHSVEASAVTLLDIYDKHFAGPRELAELAT